MQVKINVRNTSSCGSAASTPSSPPGLLSPIMATNNKSIPQKSINNQQAASASTMAAVSKNPNSAMPMQI